MKSKRAPRWLSIALIGTSAVALATLLAVAAFNLGVGSVEVESPTPESTQAAPDVTCRDAAIQQQQNAERVMVDLAIPLMLEGADPESPEMKATLRDAMADYESTYWDAQRRCDGEEPAIFED